MKPKQIFITLLTVAAGGIVIAGQTMGWEKFLAPLLSQPKIEFVSTQAPFKKTFYAEEIIRLKLVGIETDRVYWLFDETGPIINGIIEVEHSFPFVQKEPKGVEQFRRVDAFYKDRDSYGHASAFIPVSNLQMNFSVSVDSEGIKSSAISGIVGQWKLSNLSLASYEDGKFTQLNKQPTNLSASKKETAAMWDFSGVADAFGYRSVEEAKGRVAFENNIWVFAEYESIKGNASFRISRPVPNKDSAIR